MAHLQGAAGALSAGRVVETEGCDSSTVALHSLPTNDELSVDEVIFINPLTPPLPAFIAPESDSISKTEPARDREHAGLLISDTPLDPVIKGMKEDPSWATEAVSTKSVSVHAHECSLCDKAFSTASALNKHLLSHQQDRPHVCPICQRAFKRNDHLNAHMLTHQKRKPFHCVEPGCQKSYCDSYALKRHCASQHGVYLMPPSSSSSAQVLAAPGVWGDGVGGVGRSDYHSVFFSPPKPTSTAQHKSGDYPVYEGFHGYVGFAGLGVSSDFQEPRAPQARQPPLVPESWAQAACMEMYGEGPGELHTARGMSVAPQWVPSLEPEINNVTVSSSCGSRLGGLGPPCWESGLDFPVSELQALEEMLSLQTPREALNSAGACSTGPPPPPSSSSSIVMKQRPRQATPRGRPEQQPAAPSASALKGSASGKAPKSVKDSALGRSSPEQLCQLSPTGAPKPAPQRGQEAKKKRARKRKVKETDLPALPLPAHPPASLSAPRRQRPRPLYLVSPSQVAMASFSTDGTPCQPSKGGKLAENGQETDDRGHHGPLPSETANSQSETSAGLGKPRPVPSTALVQQGEKEEGDLGQWQHPLEASCAVKQVCLSPQMPLSPLVIPVSVPVTDRKEVTVEYADGDRATKAAAERPRGGAGTLKRGHRFEFPKMLFIPPPAPPQTSPPRVSQEAVGGQWCRVAGGYPSQLRSPVYLVDHLLNPGFQPPPYTPPPMLSPVRRGTGLYFNTLPPPHPGPPPPSMYTTTLDVADGISLMMDDTVVTVEPRINVGSRFQADIPPLRNRLQTLYEDHPAQLLWAPWGDIDSNPKTQQRVTELLDLCCSSVLPGGGTNTELALHCLHEVQGNMLAALDLLLIRGDYHTSSHALRDYHYTGSDHWSPREKRLFRRALFAHNKDFQLIHGVLQSKSVAQCVEYYYAMKKLKKFKLRTRGPEVKEEGGTNPVTGSPGGREESLLGRIGSRKALVRHVVAPLVLKAPAGTLKYPCEECGRSFEKVKSRSAHMKTHRKQ